jgi:O-antigen/teichoic acid export membrane protein
MSINHRRISLSVASGLLLEIINKISPLLILHHAQKSLGLPDFGWAQYQLALFEVVQPFVTYGFASYALAEASAKGNVKSELQNLFTHILVLKLMNAALVSLFYFISYQFNSSSHSDRYSFDILLVVMIAGVADSFWLCIARHKLAAISLISGVLRVLSLILILTFVETAENKHLFVMLSLLPNAVISLATGLYSFRELAFSPIVSSRLKDIFRRSTPFALIVLLVAMLDRIDIFLVERWFGLGVAGIYSGPAKVVQSLSMIISSLALPFYAEILNVHEKKVLYKHVSLSLWCLSALISPIIFGLPFIETEVIQTIFTNLPKSADQLVSLLSIGMIGTVLLSVFGLQILMSKSRPWPIIWGGLIFVMTIPLMVWIMQERFGFKAAAYSIVIGKIGLGLFCLHFAKDFLPKIPWLSLFKPLLAGAGMAYILQKINADGMMEMIMWGAVAYLFCLLLSNFREFNDILRHPKINGMMDRWR